MSERPSPESPYYPPRARGPWTGRRARVGVLLERGNSRFRRGLWWLVQALIPGMPFALRRRWGIAAALWAAYLACLGAFFRHHDLNAPRTMRMSVPLFLTFEFQPVYLWMGLAAGLHVASVQYLLFPVSRDWSVGGRVALSLLAFLLVFGLIYAPLLDWLTASGEE